jgi:hypothetical protein
MNKAIKRLNNTSKVKTLLEFLKNKKMKINWTIILVATWICCTIVSFIDKESDYLGTALILTLLVGIADVFLKVCRLIIKL